MPFIKWDYVQKRKTLFAFSFMFPVLGALFAGIPTILFLHGINADLGPPGPAPKTLPPTVLQKTHIPLLDEIKSDSIVSETHVAPADQQLRLTIALDGMYTEHGQWRGKDARLEIGNRVFPGQPDRTDIWGAKLVDLEDQLAFPSFKALVDGPTMPLRTTLEGRAEMKVDYPKQVSKTEFEVASASKALSFEIIFLPRTEYDWFKRYYDHERSNKLRKDLPFILGLVWGVATALCFVPGLACIFWYRSL